MAIPASHIVNILPRVISGGSSDLELNGLLLSESSLISASTLALSFSSSSAVADYFGTGSQEAICAEVYFTSFNNKSAAPKEFYVARRISKDVAAFIRSAKFAGSLAELKKVTDGAFVLSIDNTAQSITDIDLSSATSLSDVANLIEAKMTGATVAYSSLNGAFTITSNTTGETSEVGFASAPASGSNTASADLSALLNLLKMAI